MNPELVEKLLAVHRALKAHSLPHAFGGAIALAYCVEEPRGTRDLDLNIFIAASDAGRALEVLPDGVRVSRDDVEAVERNGQTRLFWDGVPIDVFFNNLPLHDEVAGGVLWVPLGGEQIPVLDCASLVVFKSLFNRARDWGDIEEVAETTPTDVEAAAKTVAALVGEDDPSYRRLAAISENHSP